MKLWGLEKTTLLDYPGRVACTVFTLGCNFRCPFCYSAELVLPERMNQSSMIKEEDFFEFLREKQGLLEGVVVCGGEPTIQGDLREFIKKIKNLGFLVKLDTNGSNPEILNSLIKEGLLDYIAMDLKAPLEKYNEATGTKVVLESIKQSIDLVKNSGIDYEFRTTVVPGLLEKKDILDIASLIKNSRKYFLQNFRPEKTLDPAFEKRKPFFQKELEEIVREISPWFEVCGLR